MSEKPTKKKKPLPEIDDAGGELPGVAQQFFYHPPNYLVDTGSAYIPVGVRSLRNRLKQTVQPHEISDAICQIEDKNFVSYAGPLAGCDRGLHTSADGLKLLATTSPQIIASKEGKWTTIESLIRSLLVDGEIDQHDRFYGWLNSARWAVLDGRPSPACVLGLTGPRKGGKSSLIDVIDMCMTQRRGDPCAYFTGGRFNADLLGCELLVMDDQAVRRGESARQSLKQRMKNFFFSGKPYFEAKGKDAFCFAGVWRGVIATNDAEDDLRALPPVDSGTADKLLYLKCGSAFPEILSDEEYATWRKEIKSEIPAFCHFIENFEIPAGIRGSRGRVAGWQHPDIMDKLHSHDGWLALMNIIDCAFEQKGIKLPWTGRATELETLLTSNGSPVKRGANNLFGQWHSKGGVLLTEAALHSGRVREMTKKPKKYRIDPPEGYEPAPDEDFLPGV